VAKFPVDAPFDQVLRALQALGFTVVRTGNHISLVRHEPDGTATPMTLPGHRTIKGSTLRTALTQGGISRDDFLRAYDQAQAVLD
jgi:predicted RNA binding protein YcfA (HicA-like mRNA interferase family)